MSRKVLLNDEQVTELLVTVWLDGFLSGGSTLLEAVGIPEPVAHQVANKALDDLNADPIARLALEEAVRERLTGTDTGDKTVRIIHGDHQ